VVPPGAQVKLVAGSQHQCQTDLRMLARPPGQHSAFFIRGGVRGEHMANWWRIGSEGLCEKVGDTFPG
jgi:hypothetical protein